MQVRNRVVTSVGDVTKVYESLARYDEGKALAKPSHMKQQGKKRVDRKAQVYPLTAKLWTE
jgi:hypothetical protein